MRDEPGGGVGFSHKMSLEEGIGMLGIDHQHGRRRRAEPGGNPGVSGIERGGEFRSSGPEGVIRMGGPAFAARLAQLSVAHLYRLRKSRTYHDRRMVYQSTRPTQV